MFLDFLFLIHSATFFNRSHFYELIHIITSTLHFTEELLISVDPFSGEVLYYYFCFEQFFLYNTVETFEMPFTNNGKELLYMGVTKCIESIKIRKIIDGGFD